jgi:phosphoribosylglycinamide formyltransferase-1
MTRTLKCVIVISTGGAVINVLLRNLFFKSQIFSVVSDRSCPAITKAANHGLPTQVFDERSKAKFCDRLLAYLESNEIDYIIAFYTKLFVGELLEKYADRIINLHPSLLPAFKGLHALEESLRYRPRYLGTTIHFVDERMDEGKVVLQTVFPLDPDQPEEAVRHRLFEQQCKSLLQVVRWLAEDRIQVQAGRVVVAGARFNDFEFSPELDYAAAREWMSGGMRM